MQGLEAYFPDCSRAEAQVRPQAEGFETWEERAAAAREARRAALREKFEQEPRIRAVLEVLGGSLKEVLLEDEQQEKRR